MSISTAVIFRYSMTVGLILAVTSLAQAVEPWADPKLPVHDGLQLWIEAGRQRKAADAREAPPFTQGAKREIVFDGSGHRRDLRQPDETAQPQFHRIFQSSDLGYLRFDGQNDAVLAEKLDARLDSFTLFYVAAPRGNPGGSRALFSLSALGENKSTQQLPIDLGNEGSPQFSALFVSGPGFETPVNIMRRVLLPFGTLHNFEIASDGGKKAFRVRVDGQITGERPCEIPALGMAGLMLGARYDTAAPSSNRAAGFSQADVCEVLVYNRALSEDEATQVRGYLAEKYRSLMVMLARDIVPGSEELVSVMNPPPVQIFVPGFTVRELPIELSNINNLRSRADGTLVALGYDGNIWLIRDTDGDGLEDRADLFWDGSSAIRGPIGMDLTPPGYRAGNGAFVASKGKCSLVVDTNGDDSGDTEIVIAEGWTALPHGVDAVGVACDPRDGSVYFGLGTSNYGNAYIVDTVGKAGYSLKSERGTIMRIAPDLKSREIFATGVRFPVGLAFNRRGDLFATDQEGATWLPNGNPFDELLHIQQGRHYGFPPRHPRHLPGVIDEPSVFDYAPQHQSTCGLCFNDPVLAGGRTFGPKEWAGDLFVAGYSRGKLYRTKLSQTKAGYVAATELLGCTTMLPAEVCVTSDGGLIVACHSGGPDWGSGPTGKGKLYKLTYSEPESPRPVFAWPATPGEIHVAFDRPINPEDLRDAVRQMKLTAGRHVRAGDRFESLWPGYAAVHAQKGAPRFDVPVRSAQLLPDRRTLILATDAHNSAVHYALKLPAIGKNASSGETAGRQIDQASRRVNPGGLADGGGEPRRSLASNINVLPQSPETDLDFDLSGCEATWKPADGGSGWNGWLPHVDLQVARELKAGSQRHDALWSAMAGPGVLTLKTQIDLTDMLRPAVQPGSRIDYEWPPEQVTLTFESAGRLTVRVVDGTPVELRESSDRSSATLTLNPLREKTLAVELTIEKAAGVPSCVLAWHTHEDSRARAMPVHRLLVPWAHVTSDKPRATVRAKELEGGNWARGRQEFYGQQAGCSKCHSIHGQGGQQGPDLSNLGHRDYASVLRDITEPNFAINPDFLSYVLTLKNGNTLSGTVRTAGDTLLVGDAQGTVASVARADVEEMVAASTSTMPEGLPKQLSPERLRDLLTYLLTPTPQMPRDYSGERPKPRPRAAVDALLAGAPTPAEPARHIRIVLVAGPKDHRPGEHDYPAWQKVWGELLSLAEGVEVATADVWPAPEEFEKADVLVFYQHGVWDEKRAAQIDPFLARGGGLVYIHFAVDGGTASDDFSRRIGLAWKSGPGFSKFRHGALDLVFNRDRRHPIARNFESFSIVDESYWNLAGSLSSENVVATGIEQGQPQPLFWTVQHPQGRVFVSIPGHFSWTFDDPLFRVLLLRGIAWAAHEPVDRFNDLVWPGADIID